MAVHSVCVVSESGTLQFWYDHSKQHIELEEKTYHYPLPYQFKVLRDVIVSFGAFHGDDADDVKVGYAVVAVNGIPANGSHLQDKTDILQVIRPFHSLVQYVPLIV